MSDRPDPDEPRYGREAPVLGQRHVRPGLISVPGDTRLVFPTGQVLVHSTGDPGLPQPGQSMPWPVYGPRDMSLLSEWHGYFGAFAQPQAQAGFMGAQSPGAAGIMRSFPPDTAIGTKFFGLGDIPYSRYSQTQVVPGLWGGWTASFWSYQLSAAGQSVQWQENSGTRCLTWPPSRRPTAKPRWLCQRRRPHWPRHAPSRSR